MNNKSNFLNLPSGLPGDARRHVPFRSIIHKHISFIFALVFFLLHCFLVPLSAAMIQPEFNPIIGATASQVQSYVSSLTPDQLEIFYLLSGSQAVSYTGFGNYELTEQLDNSNSVSNWIKEIGERFYTDLFLASIGMPSEVAKPILSALQGTAQYASGINTTYDQWLNSVNSSEDPFLIPLGVELIPAYNQVFASVGGLYDWQFVQSSWDNNTFTWRTEDFWNQTQLNNYNTYVSNFPENNEVYFCNSSQSVYSNLLVSCPDIGRLKLFINSSNNTVQLIPISNYTNLKYVYNQGGIAQNPTSGLPSIEFRTLPISIQFSNYAEVAKFYLNSYDGNSLVRFYSNQYNIMYFKYVSYVDEVLVGSSLENAVAINNVEGLDFQKNDLSYVLAPLQNLLLDIKGLISDLVEVNSLKEPVFDNLYDTNGQPDNNPAVQQLSVSVQLPDSGIDIPNNLFAPLTRDGGYISYLWYMTKPLVKYTYDFVQTMVFDGNEDFDITGPGAIVFGVISLGLIGGLVVKCLL